MKTVTLSVASREEVTGRARAAFAGKKQGAHISFASVDLLWQTLTGKRWELLKLMTGENTMTIREITRRSGRDVKTVHGDIHALLAAGVLERIGDGRIVFPYSAVHVDFILHKVTWSAHRAAPSISLCTFVSLCLGGINFLAVALSNISEVRIQLNNPWSKPRDSTFGEPKSTPDSALPAHAGTKAYLDLKRKPNSHRANVAPSQAPAPR